LNIYEQKQRWKRLLFLMAVAIGIGSLAYTNRLVEQLSIEERKKIELWAEATRQLISLETDNMSDLDFQFSVIENNTTVPVILTDSSGNILTHRNLDSLQMLNPIYRQKQLKRMMEKEYKMVIDLGPNDRNYIYYNDSHLLQQLAWFPYVQLAVIVLFIAVSYLAFSSSRRAEQNKVWVGLSKETAHQLGTPTSSLNAWLELLKTKQPENSPVIPELEKDVHRLEKIAERFSKIGSMPVLTATNLLTVVENSVSYLKTRSSDAVKFEIECTEKEVIVPLNEALFEWVIENVCKNAMDAMGGKGKITIKISDHIQIVYIDITDSGKGIPRSKFKTIFKPGYTTKDRGWGLGLSLSKRIVESYHEGRIFVLASEPDKRTTLRIVLHK
jgi:signal transduction histidine kinase